MSRPISEIEAAVVERVMKVAPMRDIGGEVFSTVRSLRVTATCKCGCGTLWFGPDGDASTGVILADARGTAEGGDMDLIVWFNQGAVVGLELVGVDAVSLPAIDSIRGHDVA
jgi:hypothetical protein